MGMFRRALIVAAALALSGCWLQPGFGPDRQNSNPFEHTLTPANVDTLHQIWSVPTSPESQPLVTPAAVYTETSRDGFLTIQAFARSTGALLWQRDLPVPSGTRPFVGLLSVADGAVLTARQDPSGAQTVFETLDPTTGTTTSSMIQPGSVDIPSVAVGADVIAYRTSDITGTNARLVVRRRDTLAVSWSAPTTPPPFELRENPILVHGGLIYLRDGTATSGAPAIRAFPVDGCGSPTCSPTWMAEVPSPVTRARLLAITDDGHLLVHRMSDDLGHLNDLVALRSDGSPDWTLPLADLTGVASAGDTVFAVGIEKMYGDSALFVHSGSTTWRAEGLLFNGTPAVAGGLVYVGLDRTEGNGVAVFDAGGCGAATCSPVKVLDAGSPRGGLYGISVTAGTVFVSKTQNPGGQLIAYAPTG
jgi:hypothetical protein